MNSWRSYQTLVKLVIADIQQLTKRDVKVIVVLDGGDLPQKAWARKKRDKDLPGAEDTYVAFLQRFNDNSQKVLQEQGPVLWEAERKRLARRCVSRTPDMTTAVIKGLRHAHSVPSGSIRGGRPACPLVHGEAHRCSAHLGLGLGDVWCKKGYLSLRKK